MNTKKDPTDIADALASDLDYMRTLLNAAGYNLMFYLENRKLLGPYGELLYTCANELDNLLFLVRKYLEKMDGEVEAVSDLLYAIEPPQAEHS